MTPKPETQGETYAGMLGRMRTNYVGYAHHPEQAAFMAWIQRKDITELMVIVEWQAAQIEALRARLETALQFVDVEGPVSEMVIANGHEALVASAPDAIIEVKP